MRRPVIKAYFYKMFLLLPLTFLFAPYFYALLGYQPGIPGFGLFVYFLCAFFIYLGMSAALLLKRYKYLAHIAVAAAAFLLKNVAIWPLLAGAEKTQGEAGWYAMVMFAAALIMGLFGIYYSRYSALNFIGIKNMVLFVNIAVIGAVYYLFSGIMKTDPAAAAFYICCLVCFFASYFLVRNFTALNRQIEIYRERGAYSASGTRRIYLYYFASVCGFSVIPLVICYIVVPPAVNIIKPFMSFLIAKIILALEIFAHNQPPAEPDIGENIGGVFFPGESGNELLVYYIIFFSTLIIAAVLIFVFRKNIAAFVKYLLERLDISGFENRGIIENEITQKIKKDKKHIASYRSYLKKARKFKALRERYTFAYYCVFWRIVKLEEENLKESVTPEEMAEYIKSNPEKSEKYRGFSGLTCPYEDIKYGDMDMGENENLRNMMDSAEGLLKKIL